MYIHHIDIELVLLTFIKYLFMNIIYNIINYNLMIYKLLTHVINISNISMLVFPEVNYLCQTNAKLKLYTGK